MPAGNAKSNPDNITGYFPGETTDIRITPPERVSFDFVSNINAVTQRGTILRRICQ